MEDFNSRFDDFNRNGGREHASSRINDRSSRVIKRPPVTASGPQNSLSKSVKDFNTM